MKIYLSIFISLFQFSLQAQVDQTPPALEPSFNSIKENIFDNKCMACHGRRILAWKYPLWSAKDLINYGLVQPGNAEESILYQVIQPNARNRMPPRITRNAPLTDEEIKIIKTWIDEGALEN
jgi:uncharacterized membrane protein